MGAEMNMPILSGAATLTMSSREIAELCGKRHDHVLRDIRVMLAALYGDESVNVGMPDRDKFEAFFDKMGWGIDSPDLGNGRVRGVRVRRDARGFIDEISLDYNHTMTLVAGYKVKLRKAIIDKWQELEGQARVQTPVPDLSDPAVLVPLLTSYAQRTQAAERKVAELSPKAEAYDLLDASEGAVNVRVAAKMLNVPERKFTSWLEANRWAFRQNGIGPLQAYVEKRNCGYLEHRPHTYHDRGRGEDRTVAQLMITPKGLARLAQIFSRGGDLA